MIHFDWLLLLWLAPLPLLIYLLPAIKQTAQGMFFPTLAQYQHIEISKTPPKKSRMALFLLSLSWLCLLLALAKPVYIGEAIHQPLSGRDIFLAVDISGSMQIEDMQLNGRTVNRLVMVKHVLSDFIQKRQGDRLGLVVFASQAFVQAPLTYDLITVEKLLQETLIGFAGQQTAIGDAIGLTLKRLDDKNAHQRVLILLTDGANNAGNIAPLKAAELAKQKNLLIHTIAFGSDQPIQNGFFGFGGARASDDIDEESLQQIAAITGGKYFRARNQQELESIYALLDKLEQHESDDATYRPQKDIFYYPLSISFILLFLLIILQKNYWSKGI